MKFGDSHSNTIKTMNNLAITYEHQGKHRDAEVLYKQCLDKRKIVLGENHPDTLAIIGHLSRNEGGMK